VVVVVRVRVGVGRSGLDLRGEGFHLERGRVSARSRKTRGRQLRLTVHSNRGDTPGEHSAITGDNGQRGSDPVRRFTCAASFSCLASSFSSSAMTCASSDMATGDISGGGDVREMGDGRCDDDLL
jgi:hypothetical protein